MNENQLQKLIDVIVPGGILDLNTGNWFGIRTGKHWFCVHKRNCTPNGEHYYGNPYNRNRLLKEIEQRFKEMQEAFSDLKN